MIITQTAAHGAVKQRHVSTGRRGGLLAERPWWPLAATCRIVMLSIVLCVAIVGPLQADALPQGPIPSGWGVQLKANNATPETLDVVRDLGLTVVRRGFLWTSIEPKPGVFDFEAADAFVEACSARGIRIVGAIAFNNSKLYGRVTEDRGRRAYAQFAATLAQRYEKYGIIWELWNEPNTRTFWGKHARHNSEQFAAEYTALVLAAGDAIRHVAPSSTVVAGSVSSLWEPSYEWQRHCFTGGMRKAALDGWSLHPYGLQRPEAYIAAYERVRRILVETGEGKLPLLNSECGYRLHTDKPTKGRISTEQQQAEHLVRQYLIDHLTGMRASIWYEWRGNEGFGMHDIKGPKEPMTDALRTLVEELRGYSQVQRMPTDSGDDFVLLYRHPHKPPKMVAWTVGSSHVLKLPAKFAGRAPVRRMFGKGSILSPSRMGRIALRLSSAPRYVSLSELDEIDHAPAERN